MASRSPECIDPSTAAIAGAQLLDASPDHVEFLKIGEDGLRIRIKPRPSEMTKMILAMFVGSVASFFVSWTLNHFHWADDIKLQYFGHPSAIFLVFGFLFAGLGILLLLFRTTTGPDRDVIVEVAPGWIKVDRYAARDHVVREYNAGEVRSISLGDGVVNIVVSTGEIMLAASHSLEFRFALVSVIALGLWQQDVSLVANIPVGGRVVPLIAVATPRVQDS